MKENNQPVFVFPAALDGLPALSIRPLYLQIRPITVQVSCPGHTPTFNIKMEIVAHTDTHRQTVERAGLSPLNIYSGKDTAGPPSPGC